MEFSCEMHQLHKSIKLAYKKLKSHIYYDKKNLFLRKKLVEFEENHEYDFEKKFKELAEEILTGDISKYYNNIKINTLPKSFTCNSNNIFRNCIRDEQYKLEKVIDFIDLSIEAHIISVLWILMIGEKIEKTYDKYTSGNKLDDKFQKENLKLFKPYYYEYEKWRDDAIQVIDNRMNENKRSIMISIDIKEYFYSTNICFEEYEEEFKEWYEKGENKELTKILNKFIQGVVENYSKKMLKKENKRNILPIGFLPSSILSNWYLKELDKEITSKLNPLYYKRYVDDIIIVINGDFIEESNVEIETIFNDLFCKKNILKCGFIKIDKENSWKNEIIEITNKLDFRKFISIIPREEIELKKEIIKILKELFSEEKEQDLMEKIKEMEIDLYYSDWNSKNSNLEEIIYKIEKQEQILTKFYNDHLSKFKINSSKIKKIFFVNKYLGKTYLAIQDEKVKIYDFKEKGSKSVIEQFKKELKNNASVFKFLPEKVEVLDKFDTEVYKIDYKESNHKLSSINNINIDKYSLSKFLANIIYSDKLENVDYTKEIDDKILWIFEGNRSIEYYSLWEKVFYYYLLNNKFNHIIKIFKNITKSIENLEQNITNFRLIKLNLKNDEILVNIKRSLSEYLEITLCMSCALNEELSLYFINEIIGNKIQQKQMNSLKERMRKSNMLHHSLVRQPLINYCYRNYLKNNDGKYVDFINDRIINPSIKSDMRCHVINKNYKDTKTKIFNSEKKCEYCINEIDSFSEIYNPRFVHLHECILYTIHCIMAWGKILEDTVYIKQSINLFKKINNLKEDMPLNIFKLNNEETTYKKNQCNDYICNIGQDNKNNCNIKDLDKKNFYNHYTSKFNTNEYLFVQKEININYLEINKEEKKNKLKIGIVHMEVEEENLKKSFNKTSNLDSKRLENIYRLLNESVKNGAEMIIFPEVSIPFQWLSVIANFSKRHDIAIICGLEHIIYENGLCCNYIATILPNRYKEYNYSIIKLRLKNYYSPKEKEWVLGNNWTIPKSKQHFEKEYDLFRWKGIDFSNFSCFELANIRDRSLFISYVDLLVGSVHNKDVNYYSNIIESLSRDVHCYFAHVNNSRLGDNRIVSPSSTNNKNILQITGGLNDTVLIGEIDIRSLRNFQKLAHNLQIDDETYKPVPPEFNYINVKIRDELPL